jgi:hypothetical protein
MNPNLIAKISDAAYVGNIDFFRSSRAEQAVQDRLSAFDAEQSRLDKLLDKNLTICRC